MSDALPPLQGGCLCGQVRYEASPTHRNGYYCHCRMCQLAVGNIRAAFFNLRKDQMRWLNGPPAYYASSKIARRGFCGHCGTPLSFEFLDGANIDLSAGSLDEPGQLRPSEHFGLESRIAAWHVDDGLPGSRLDANAGIVQRWHAAYGEGAAPGLQTVRRAGAGTMAAPPPTKDSTKDSRMRLLHTMLRVGDLQRSIDFYTQALGMQLLRRTQRPEQKYDLAFVGYAGNPEQAEIELTYNHGVDRYDMGSAYGHIAIGVPDVAATCEAVRARAAALGGAVTREAGPVKGGSTVIAFVTDPDGYKIELIQRDA